MTNRQQNLEIWTCLKWPRKAFCKLRPALRIMRVRKYGATCLMITKVTFGVWDASYSSQWLWSLHSGRRPWKDCSRKFWLASIQGSQLCIPKIWQNLSGQCCKCNRIWDRTVIRFWKWTQSTEGRFSTSLRIVRMQVNSKTSCWKLLCYQRI